MTEGLQFKWGKVSSLLKNTRECEDALLDVKNPGNDSKVDWHSMLNFELIITHYERNIINFDISFVKVGFMKNVPFMKTNAAIVECRLCESMN